MGTEHLPQVARPITWTIWSKRCVTRAHGSTKGVSRSAKILRAQVGSSQKYLRTCSTRQTGCPPIADPLLGGCTSYGFSWQPLHIVGSERRAGSKRQPRCARRHRSAVRRVPIPLGGPEQASPPSVSGLSSSRALFPWRSIFRSMEEPQGNEQRHQISARPSFISKFTRGIAHNVRL